MATDEDDDDDFLRATIDEAENSALMPALAQLTGDLTLRDELRPDPADHLSPQGAPSDEQLAAARELALRTLSDWRDRGCPDAPEMTADEVGQLIAFTTGGALGRYLPLLVEELAHDGGPGRPGWMKAELAPDSPLHFLIIGAGMSRLAPCTDCGSPGCRSRSSKRTAKSAASGWRTPTRAAGAAFPTTFTASPPLRSKAGRGSSPPSRRC